MINVLRSVLDIKFGHFIFSSGLRFCCVISISVQPAGFNFLEFYKVQPGPRRVRTPVSCLSERRIVKQLSLSCQIIYNVKLVRYKQNILTFGFTSLIISTFWQSSPSLLLIRDILRSSWSERLYNYFSCQNKAVVGYQHSRTSNYQAEECRGSDSIFLLSSLFAWIDFLLSVANLCI